jgi:endonuclease/exonuclease/phosphatase family metal-dependent hydrolase
MLNRSLLALFTLSLFISVSSAKPALGAADFKALTYNLWGLSAPLSKNLEPRIDGFCNALKTQAPEERWDVILLQEVWSTWIADRLKKCGYDYSVRLDSGSRETGLMILSPHPLEDAHRMIFKTQPKGWDAFKNGESLVSKGALSAIVRHPELGSIFVANTHVAANYGLSESFEHERMGQLIEFSQLIQAKSQGLPAVIGGDFNVAPYGISYTLLWESLPSIFKGFKRYPAHFLVSTRSDKNPYSGTEEGQLDHLFGSQDLVAVSGQTRFDRDGELFSDHYGWETVFEKSQDSLGQ